MNTIKINDYRNNRIKTAAAITVLLAVLAQPGWADESGVWGGNAGFDDITGSVYDSLASAVVTVPANSVGSIWNCAVTCSAEVKHETSLSKGSGTFGILDDGLVVAGSERTFEINDNAGINDPSPIVISTTIKTTVDKSSSDTLACAIKENTGDFDINDSSITVTCSDFP